MSRGESTPRLPSETVVEQCKLSGYLLPSPSALVAFDKSMADGQKQYGEQETLNAFLWFVEGYCAATPPSEIGTPSGQPDWVPALTFLQRHRRHVELSPGAGKDAQTYALAVLDDLENDLRSLLPKASESSPSAIGTPTKDRATPRTDARIKPHAASCGIGELAEHCNDLLDFARQLERELAEARFRPMGDNHHNALACPYCQAIAARSHELTTNNAGSPTATADSAARDETVGPEAKAQVPCSGSPAPLSSTAATPRVDEWERSYIFTDDLGDKYATAYHDLMAFARKLETLAAPSATRQTILEEAAEMCMAQCRACNERASRYLRECHGNPSHLSDSLATQADSWKCAAEEIRKMATSDGGAKA